MSISELLNAALSLLAMGPRSSVAVDASLEALQPYNK